jgi:hypothetical protein
MLNTSLKKIALALGSLAILGAATNASAFPDFSVQPGAIKPAANVPGGINNLDTIKGGASERLLVTSPTTFAGNGLLTLDTFFSGANLAFVPLASGFKMYITFSLTDTLTGGTLGAPGSTYSLTSLSFQIFADVNGNNVFTAATTALDPSAGTAAQRTDDVELGYGSLLAGAAVLNSGGGSNGAALNSTESLFLCSAAGTAKSGGTTVTSATDPRAAACASGVGTAFFFAPSPFYSIAFDEFNNTQVDFVGGALALTGGSGSINFAIPEPGSIALLGIAAVAAGLTARRRRSKA